jgi:tetratricopeptide (TPR) repeat protein
MSGDARYQLYDSVRDAMSTLLDRGPRVIVLDDFHNAPPPLVGLFAYLVRSIVARDGGSLLVLAAVDTDRKAPDIAEFVDGTALALTPTRIQLGPLDEKGVNRIVAELLGHGTATDTLASLLHQETQGNPFFIAEFMRSLIRQGVIVERESGGYRLTVKASDLSKSTLSIPVGVRHMVRARLTPLDRQNREVIDALSVAGRETDLDVLLDVVSLGEEQALDAVDSLVDEGMLRERRAGEQALVDFVHRKVGDVAYLELEAGWRGTLHRRIAVALEMRHAGSPVIAEAIGEHYLRAGENGKAFRYLATSALRLWERALAQQAWDISERAMLISESAQEDLNETEHTRARLKLLRVRADVAYNRGAWVHAEQVLASLHNAAQKVGDAKVAADARLCRGVALRRIGRQEAGEEMIRWVVEDARSRGDRRAMIEGLRHLAVLAWEQGNLDETENLANEGLASASGSSELDESRAGILVALTAVQAERGQLAAATSGLAEAEAIFRRLRNKRSNCVTLCNLAELLLWQGEISEAHKKGTEAVELARDVQYRVGETAALRVRAMALMDAGDLTRAGEDLEQALVISEEQGLAEEVVATRFLCGRLALRLDDAAASVEHLRVGLGATADGDPESYQKLLQAMLARALLVNGQTEEATSILTDLAAQFEEIAVPRLTQIMGVMALAWRSLGEDEHALRLARESARIAGTRGFRLWSLTARMILADVGSGDEATQAHMEAVTLARDLCRALPHDLAVTFRTRRGISALLTEN